MAKKPKVPTVTMKAEPASKTTPSSTKAVSDLSANPKNPRTVTDTKLAQLKRSMSEFGDISGIVFNVRDGFVYGGTQRTKNLDASAKVTITKTFEKPTKAGTLRLGYIEQDGERFNYREVDWDSAKAEAAMLAANSNAGVWDPTKLGETFQRLGSFDVNIDLDLTMFTESERLRYLPREKFVAEEHWTENFEPPDDVFQIVVSVPSEKLQKDFLRVCGIKKIRKKTGNTWSVQWPE